MSYNCTAKVKLLTSKDLKSLGFLLKANELRSTDLSGGLVGESYSQSRPQLRGLDFSKWI